MSGRNPPRRVNYWAGFTSAIKRTCWPLAKMAIGGRLSFPTGRTSSAGLTASLFDFRAIKKLPCPSLAWAQPRPPRPYQHPYTTHPTPSCPRLTELPTLCPHRHLYLSATAAALLAKRGTPDPALTDLPAESRSSFDWDNFPWGILSLVVIAAFFWYQFYWRRRRKSG